MNWLLFESEDKWIYSQMFYCDADPYAGRVVQNVTNHVSQNMLYTIYPNVFNEAIDRYPYSELLEDVMMYYGHNPVTITDRLTDCEPAKMIEYMLEAHPREYLTYLDAERSLTTICSDLSVTEGQDVIASLLLSDRLSLISYLSSTYPTEGKAALNNFLSSYTHFRNDAIFNSLTECEFKSCLKTKWVEMGLDSGMMLNYARTESWANIVHKLYENGEDSLNYLFAYYYFGGMIELLENWHYPLIGFMNRVESYYGTETRDALDGDTLIAIQYLSLSEYHIYGSSRLGILKMDDTLKKADIFYRVWLSDMSRVEMSVTLEEANRYTHDSSHTLYRGRKMYEGTNHLGNVLVVYSDKRLNACNEDTVTYYKADLVQATDYSAFGVVMEEREWYVGMDSSIYRMGFGGMEKDDEMKGVGNSMNFESRIYDSRLGRFLSVDLLWQDYAYLSPYVFADNSPIWCIDKDGESAEKTNTDPIKVVKAAIEVVMAYKENKTEYSQQKRQIGIAADYADCSTLATTILNEAGYPNYFNGQTHTGSGKGGGIQGEIKKMGGASSLKEPYRKKDPRPGDIMMWGTHITIVTEVKNNKVYFATMGSSGASIGSAKLDKDNSLQSEDTWGSGGFWGFWTPPSDNTSPNGGQPFDYVKTYFDMQKDKYTYKGSSMPTRNSTSNSGSVQSDGKKEVLTIEPKGMVLF